MGVAWILLRFVHQHVFAGFCTYLPKKIKHQAARVLKDQGMSMIKSTIGHQLEAKKFVKTQCVIPVTDANTNVINFFYFKHPLLPSRCDGSRIKR